jgi:lipopolysaccharide export system protein LptA
MIKFLLLITFCIQLYASERVEINADNFEADENKRVSNFTGNVHIKKGEDEIYAEAIKIDFDKKNKPLKYEATGGVTFTIHTNSQLFDGTSNKIIYNPADKTYKAIGNVKINERVKNQTLKGERIDINRNSGKTKISGTKNRPVKFIFTVEE